MVLPAGSTLPAVPYLLAVVIVAAIVVVGFWRRSPTVGEQEVLALAPWILAGGTLYVVYETGGAPAALAPLFSSPIVYLTTGSLAGLVWLAADRTTATNVPVLATSGVLLTTIGIAVAVSTGETFSPGIPALSLVAASLLAGILWWILRAWEPNVEVLGWAGTVLVFGHSLDGLTTVAGVVHLGFGERSPLARILIDTGGWISLPLLGEAWLFVLAKVILAAAVAWLLAPSARERPREGFLLVAFVTAVGLGPGFYNALLFTVTSP